MAECFIIMPITTSSELSSKYGGDKEHFKHVLDYLFVPALEKVGYKPIPPSASGADVIHAEIIRSLETADLVLCDMSTLNPNVFFELGIRTAVDKPVSLVKDQLTATVPFDTTLINYHTYDHSLTPWTMNNEIQALSDHLLKSLNRSEGRNSLWRYFGLTTRASISQQESTVDEKLDLIIHQLQGQGQSQDHFKPAPEIDTDKDKIIKWVITKAQEIASEYSAELMVKEILDKNITFNLGLYVLPPDRIQMIKELGKRYAINIGIVGSDLEESGNIVEIKY
jgi:hypothetical protein